MLRYWFINRGVGRRDILHRVGCVALAHILFAILWRSGSCNISDHAAHHFQLAQYVWNTARDTANCNLHAGDTAQNLPKFTLNLRPPIAIGPSSAHKAVL
jgi:hypothetical protein